MKKYNCLVSDTLIFSIESQLPLKLWFAFPLHTFDVRSNMTTFISQQNELNLFRLKSLRVRDFFNHIQANYEDFRSVQQHGSV